MTSAADVIAVAAAEVGYEADGNGDTKFSDAYGMPGAAWCAMFVSWCLRQAGLSSPYYSYCPDGVNQFRSAGLFDFVPRVGDCVFYEWNRDGVASHTGLVEAVDLDGTVHTIEGNRFVPGDPDPETEVARHTIPGEASWAEVLGFGHPLYAQPPPPEVDMTGDEVRQVIKEECALPNGSIAQLMANFYNNQYWPLFQKELVALGVAEADIQKIKAKVGA